MVAGPAPRRSWEVRRDRLPGASSMKVQGSGEIAREWPRTGTTRPQPAEHERRPRLAPRAVPSRQGPEPLLTWDSTWADGPRFRPHADDAGLWPAVPSCSSRAAPPPPRTPRAADRPAAPPHPSAPSGRRPRRTGRWSTSSSCPALLRRDPGLDDRPTRRPRAVPGRPPAGAGRARRRRRARPRRRPRGDRLRATAGGCRRPRSAAPDLARSGAALATGLRCRSTWRTPPA